MYGNFVHATNDASHYTKPPAASWTHRMMHGFLRPELHASATQQNRRPSDETHERRSLLDAGQRAEVTVTPSQVRHRRRCSPTRRTSDYVDAWPAPTSLRPFVSGIKLAIVFGTVSRPDRRTKGSVRTARVKIIPFPRVGSLIAFPCFAYVWLSRFWLGLDLWRYGASL